MKMPSRPWYPPMQPKADIFGLHPMTLLNAATENVTERKQRIARVEAGVIAAFKAAVHHLGDADARELFSRVQRRPKRGSGKALATDRDAQLLKAYDDAPEGESIASIARRLRAAGTELGNTAQAISVQIQKLLKERTAQQREARVKARHWRMATRKEPQTLLAVSDTRKK